MKKSSLLLLLIAILSLALSSPLAAQPAAEPVVRAVLFYSPTCPHCHTVINEVLTPMIEQYGAQLQVIGINITLPDGRALYQAASERFQIPPEREGVPRLIVAETVLVGSVEIPNQFPGIVEEGLAGGGIDWPDIPGLAEALASSQQPEETPPAAPAPTGEPQAATPTPTRVVLALSGESRPPEEVGLAPPGPPEGAGLAGAILGAMLLALGFATVRILPMRRSLLAVNRPLAATVKSVAIPLLSLLGLAVAAYLAYVEITHVEAVCGPVGECNVVQTSPYAQIGGAPIAVLGLINYAGIIVLWAGQRHLSGRRSGLAARALLALTLFGALFSVYLTLLELFVIRAVCVWCLSSAIITTALMLLVVVGLTGRGPGAEQPIRRRAAPA